MTGKFSKRLAGIEIETEQPRRMIVRGLSGEGPHIHPDGSMSYIDLYSSDSEIARKHERKVQKRRVEATGRRGRFKFDPEQNEADKIALLVALTAGWGTIEKDGNVVPDDFDAAAADDLYSNPANADLYNQVDEFVGARENFAKASSAT